MVSDPQLPLALRGIFNIWPGVRLNIEILHCDANKNEYSDLVTYCQVLSICILNLLLPHQIFHEMLEISK